MQGKELARKKPPGFDSLSFEIRYAFGHVYLDRCGQTLVDLERECEGWLAGESDPRSGGAARPDHDYSMQFGPSRFNFSVQRTNNKTIEEISLEISSVWRIVQANLSLTEFIRISCKFYFIAPTQSVEVAEKRLAKSVLNIQYPDSLPEDVYKRTTRYIKAGFERDGFEYQVELTGIRRAFGANPAQLAITDTRLLSKRQNEVRIAELKRASEYSVNPMFGVQFSVDCFQYGPGENLSIEEFVSEQYIIAKKDFYPIIEEI